MFGTLTGELRPEHGSERCRLGDVTGEGGAVLGSAEGTPTQAAVSMVVAGESVPRSAEGLWLHTGNVLLFLSVSQVSWSLLVAEHEHVLEKWGD